MQRSKFCSVGAISKIFERDFSMFYGVTSIIVCASITPFAPYAVVVGFIYAIYVGFFTKKSLNKFGCLCSQIYSLLIFITSSKRFKSSLWCVIIITLSSLKSLLKFVKILVAEAMSSADVASSKNKNFGFKR